MPKIKRHTIKRGEGFIAAELQLNKSTSVRLDALKTPREVEFFIQSRESKSSPTRMFLCLDLTIEEAKELWAALGEVLATVKTWRAKRPSQKPASTRSRR